MTWHEELELRPSSRSDPVAARLDAAEGCDVLYVLAHGAGAGMDHAFLGSLTERLVARRIATLRYQFPYMQLGRKRPDPPGLLEATVRSAVERGRERIADGRLGDGSILPVIAGGKSLGGRMTSNAQAKAPLAGLRGIAFLGFPLHAAKRPSLDRADHLSAVEIPMLFLQGTRDALAEMDLILPLCERLGRRATLRVVDGADHGFHVLKRSGRTDDEVLDELADQLRTWVEQVVLAE